VTHRSAIAGQGSGAAWTPPAGAIHWYYGDALRSGSWRDRVGTLDATLLNGAQVGADGLVCVNATQQYATLGSATGLGTAGSMAAWARLEDGPGSRFALYHRTGTDANRIGTSCRISNYRFAWGATAELAYSAAWSANVWRHLAITWSAVGAVHLYFDGAPVAAYSLEVLSDYDGSVTIGGTLLTPSEHTMTGNVDDVILSTVQYSDEQIADIYAHSPGSHAT